MADTQYYRLITLPAGSVVVGGSPGTGGEIFIAAPGLSLQQNSGADATLQLYRYVKP